MIILIITLMSLPFGSIGEPRKAEENYFIDYCNRLGKPALLNIDESLKMFGVYPAENTSGSGVVS